MPASRPRRTPLLADADVETPEKKTPRKHKIRAAELTPEKRQKQ
jgi:hypothetical protein